MWLPPALLALLLGFWYLGRPVLWRDELASASAARRGLGQLWDMLGNVDAVSGAYYLFLHVWIAVFGDSAVALRATSVLATALTAGLTAAVGKRLFGARAGLWAGLLYALVPTVLRYAQEARSYAMVGAAVLLATWQLVRILDCRSSTDEPWSRRRLRLEWLGYAGTLLLVGGLHLVALSVLTSHLWLVLTRRRRAWRGLLVTSVLALLLLLPLLLEGQAQSGRQINWIHRPGAHAFSGMLHNLVSSWPVAIALLALTAVACTRREGLRYLPVPVLPVLAVWCASQGANSYWVERYLLFTVPLWTVLAGYGAEGLPWRRWTAPVAVLLVAVLAFPVLKEQSYQWSHTDQDFRAAAHAVAARYRPGDAVVPERGSNAIYMVDLGLEYYLPAADKPKDLFVATDAVDRDDLMVQECAVPASCLNGADRVWVVTLGQNQDPLTGLPHPQRAALRAHYRVAQVEYVKGLTVGLLVRR